MTQVKKSLLPLEAELFFNTIKGQLLCTICGSHIASGVEADYPSRVWQADIPYRELIRVGRVNHKCCGVPITDQL